MSVGVRSDYFRVEQMTHFTPAEERRIAAAAKSWSAANNDKDSERKHRWQSAATAFRVVGKRDGATERLAKLLAITHTAVEQMAGGYAIFATLHKLDPQRARKARRQYSYHRFFSVGELWVKYEFERSSLWDYLESDLDTAKVKLEIVNHHDARPEWHRRGIHILPTLKKFRDDFEAAPDDIRECARQFTDALERYVG